MSRRSRRQPKNSTALAEEKLSRLVEAEVSRRLNLKALPPGATAAPISDALLNQMQAAQAPAKQGEPLFSPGAPMRPIPGMSPQGMPRQYSFTVGANIGSLPRANEAVTSFDTLRNLAALYDGIALCEQVWLDIVSKLSLVIKPRPELIADGANTDKAFASDIAKYTDFFSYPDPAQDLDLKGWLRMAVRDQLQIDAVAIYVRRNKVGGLYGLELVDGSCYNDEVEILTKSGWKLFSEVDIDTDLFATRNPDTKAFEWQKATYFHEADWDSDQHGEIYRFTSHALDLLVTPNHRMLVNSLPGSLGGSRHRKGEAIITAKELAENYRGATAIPATSQWFAEDVEKVVIPKTTPRSRELVFSGDNFAAFMGMYLAEGCVPDPDQVVITQKPKSKGYEAYKALLEHVFGFNPCHTGANFVIGHKALHDYLKQFGHAHEKFIPEIIKEMSRRQLKIFWHYYILGDGHIAKSDGRESATTVSKKLADDLQEIIQKMGFSTSITETHSTYDTVMSDGRVIRKENKRPRYDIRKRTSPAHLFRVERQAYKGKIYCVSVPNEILYVRHNGKPAWCGNTIKPLIDPRGRRPAPPYPAYQQFPYGAPGDLLTSDDMLYIKETPRTDSVYGLSRVERIILRVNQALRKQNRDLANFTDGTTPSGLLAPPDDGSQWTPEQLLLYQEVWDGLLAGNDQARARIKVIEPGASYTKTATDDIMVDFDRFLLNITVAAYSMTMADLGFTESVNKSSGDSQENVFYRRAVQPLIDRYAALFTLILRKYFNEQRFVVTFGGFEESEDFVAMSNAYVNMVKVGIVSPSTAARQLKLPVEIDVPPFFATANAPVFLEDAADPALRKAQLGAKVEGAKQAVQGFGSNSDAPENVAEQGKQGNSGTSSGKAQSGDESKNDDEEQGDEERLMESSPPFAGGGRQRSGVPRIAHSFPWRPS